MNLSFTAAMRPHHFEEAPVCRGMPKGQHLLSSGNSTKHCLVIPVTGSLQLSSWAGNTDPESSKLSRWHLFLRLRHCFCFWHSLELCYERPSKRRSLHNRHSMRKAARGSPPTKPRCMANDHIRLRCSAAPTVSGGTMSWDSLGHRETPKIRTSSPNGLLAGWVASHLQHEPVHTALTFLRTFSSMGVVAKCEKNINPLCGGGLLLLLLR